MLSGAKVATELKKLIGARNAPRRRSPSRRRRQLPDHPRCQWIPHLTHSVSAGVGWIAVHVVLDRNI